MENCPHLSILSTLLYSSVLLNAQACPLIVWELKLFIIL